MRQLVRLTDSEAGVCEFVYDGLGRRVRHRGADGSVREYGFSPVGLLAEVTDGGAPVARLWNDTIGQVAGVTGGVGSVACELVWDPVATMPSVLGARGADPFGLSPVASSFSLDVAGAPSGVTVAGLEVLGARAYDPVSRGFISVVPYPLPVGAGLGANVYCFVGNAPTALVDP